MATRIAVVIMLLLVAAGAGWWLGGLTAPTTETIKPVRSEKPAAEQRAVTATPDEPLLEDDEFVPPLYFFADTAGTPDLKAINAEISQAASQGIHQYIVRAPLLWEGGATRAGDVADALKPFIEADPQASVVVYLSLNPPEAWFESHGSERVRTTGGPENYASIGSITWLTEATAALDATVKELESGDNAGRIQGYVLTALYDGQWYRPGGFDRSPAALAAFRKWLQDTYLNEEALQAAWGDSERSFATVEVPDDPDWADSQNVFFELPAEQNQADYLSFMSNKTADVVERFVQQLRERASSDRNIWVPYGHSFERLATREGHCALSRLMEGDIDGFISPVSYSDRGVGGTGGFMGPLDSARNHDKLWLILDDTRTGLAEETRVEEDLVADLGMDDVYSVLWRNFAGAATHRAGLIWTDPQGEGAFNDAGIWGQFGRMDQSYREVFEPTGEEDGGGVAYSSRMFTPGVTVVIDEESRFFQRCEDPLNTFLLKNVRDTVLQAGVTANFCLLEDLLEERCQPSPAYLFVNIFKLNPSDRSALHDLLARQQAAAIWLYAPGYMSTDDAGILTGSAENVSATVGMTVQAFEEPAQSGSKWTSQGIWIEEGGEFGPSVTWSPLFYVADEVSSTCALYKASEKPSVAVKFLEEGWTSVYVAEPYISVELLRELFHTVGCPFHLWEAPKKAVATMHFGYGIIGIHAQTPGDRVLDLGEHMNINDLVSPKVGWLNKDRLTLPLSAGETRVLKADPVEANGAV